MPEDKNEHPLPVPKPPRLPKDAKVKRLKKKRSNGELLSVSKWALRQLGERHGEVIENDE